MTLTATAGAITDSGADVTTDITGGAVTLSASTTIGTGALAAPALDVDADTINAHRVAQVFDRAGR